MFLFPQRFSFSGFIDIDINQSTPGEWDPKLWVVKVRLVGYAQMDTQWQEQAKNPNWQEKARYETAPVPPPNSFLF